MSIINVTDDSFDSDVVKANKPVLVDFWAEWCGPCKQMAPHLDKFAEDMAEKVTVAKIDVDENPMTAGQYGVRGMPTLMLFAEGKIIDTHTGALSQSKITEWVSEKLG